MPQPQLVLLENKICCPNSPDCDCFEISLEYQNNMFVKDLINEAVPCQPGCMCYSCEVRR